MTGSDINPAAGFVPANRMRDDGRRSVAVGQPRLKSIAGHNLRTPRGKLPRQKSGVIADDQPFGGTGRRISDECLRDGVGGNFNVGKRERVTNDAAPTGSSKFDNRHAGIIIARADTSTGMCGGRDVCSAAMTAVGLTLRRLMNNRKPTPSEVVILVDCGTNYYGTYPSNRAKITTPSAIRYQPKMTKVCV